MNNLSLRRLWPTLFLPLLLVGCGKKDADPNAIDPDAPDMEAELAATIAEESDFYLRKDISELPADLVWQDGSEHPEFANPDAPKGGTLNYFLSDFPRTLRHLGPDATGGFRRYLLDYTQPMFLHPHPNIAGAVYPGLAESWAEDHANKTIYYRIDPNARWSDGNPVTTADVEFTFYFMRSPHLRAPWYNDFYKTNFVSVTIYDDYIFALTHPVDKPDLAARFGNFVPYPRHAFQEFGTGWIERYQWRVMPSLGAYTLHEDDIDTGRSITLRRDKEWWGQNKRFWRGRFNPDRYRFDVIRDPDKQIEAFARGDIDMVRMDPPKHWYETLSEEHPEVAAGRILRYKFYNRIPRPDWGLWINTAKPRLDDVNIRVGLHYATNFDLVCEQYHRGDAVRLETGSDGYGWRMHPTIKARRFNPEKAREYFAKAGYDQSGPDGVLQNAAGERLAFTITSPYQNRRDLVAILKQEALKAGLEYNLQVMDSTTGFKILQEKNHEIGFVALARSVELYPRYWDMFHGNNAYVDAYLGPDGQPVGKYSEGTPNPDPQQIRVQTNNMTSSFVPEIDRLIEAYVEAETMDEIKSLAEQIEQKTFDHAAWVNGWAVPFNRGAYWRYVKWPEGFNPANARETDEFMVHWVDSDERDEIERARRTGATYPNELQVFDQFKSK